MCQPVAQFTLLIFVLVFAATDISASKRVSPHSDRAPSVPADLFARPAVHEFQIELSPDAVHSLQKNSRKHVVAVVRIDGHAYPNVALHLKGSAGSFRSLEDKPGFTLSFADAKPNARFYRLKKFHLNNSVQDPTYLSELICTEMFRSAGVPAPHVSHAWVRLNGRTLGLYTLEESYDHEFLASYFKNTRGNLYGQSESADVNQPLERVQGDGENSHADLKRLAAVLEETDPSRRWEELQQVLDVDRFLSFMTMEVMLCHWDGYTFGAHNFRVYHDLDTGRMVFFPHDLDQVMGDPNVPIVPNVSGLVSQAVLASPDGRRLYRERFGTLFTNVFRPAELNKRLDALVAELTPKLRVFDSNLADGFKAEAGSLQERIVQRHAALKHQLQMPEPTPLDFEHGPVKLGAAWAQMQQGGVEFELVATLGQPVLRIQCNQPGSVGSWRKPVLLDEGAYRFSGRAKASGVVARRDGSGSGGGLRISGQPRRNQLSGNSDWVELTHEFTVENGRREVVLVCELRADAGEIDFDVDSLKLERLR